MNLLDNSNPVSKSQLFSEHHGRAKHSTQLIVECNWMKTNENVTNRMRIY